MAMARSPTFSREPPTSLASAGAALQPASLQGWARAAAVTSVLSAMVLVVLSAAVANVALPTLAEAFHVAPAISVRVVGAHQLGLVMALLPAGGSPAAAGSAPATIEPPLRGSENTYSYRTTTTPALPRASPSMRRIMV